MRQTAMPLAILPVMLWAMVIGCAQQDQPAVHDRDARNTVQVKTGNDAARMKYELDIPHHVPLVIEVPGDDGTMGEQLGRECYAAAHRGGWYDCLTRFSNGDLTLSGPVPPAGRPEPTKLATDARAAGFRACFETLRQTAGGGNEQALRSRLVMPAWYERVDDYVDVGTRQLLGMEDWDRALEPNELPTRERAFEVLLKTGTFTSTGVGAGGDTSLQLRSLKVILQQSDADVALRDLLERGEAAGQLFALCAMYFTDPESYRRGVATLRGDKRVLTYQSGCVGDAVTAGELLESLARNAVRLRDGQTLEAWFDQHESGVLDVVGGGFPHAFREKMSRLTPDGKDVEVEALPSVLGK